MNRREFLKASAGGILLGAPGIALSDDTWVYTPPPPTVPKILIHPTLASASKEPVGARLICYLDISGSIDDVEFNLQCQATAEAIASEDFRNAVFFHGGPKSIAICIADFGSLADIAVPWVDIRKGDGPKKFLELAHEIHNLKRRESGSTNHSGALEHAMLLLQHCPWQGKRNIVDLITDGTNDTGGDTVADAVDRLARLHEATVNALIIEDSPEAKTMENWARQYLPTQPKYFRKDGSFLDPGFVKVVAYEKSEESKKATIEYHDAMKLAFRRKLVLEVARRELDDLRRLVSKPVANDHFFRHFNFGL